MPRLRNVLQYYTKNSRKPTAALELLLRYGTDVNTQAIDGSLPLHDAVAENNGDMANILIAHGSSLDIEDAAGLTPLTSAIENGCHQTARFPIEAGASMNGPHWQLVPTGDGLFEISHLGDETYWSQTVRDTLEMYWVIQLKLQRSTQTPVPRSVLVRILNMAGYWLGSMISRSEAEEYNSERAASKLPYILSDPIQGRERYPVREVTIVTRSHHQGWSDYEEHHGTYSQSYTWFEIAIQKPNGRWIHVE